ncbi:colicin E3/pyocin S6 family cytotoxin [Clostridium sp. HBUAS56017]|uniref:colicin E3/pyocin S6 family cytotoxin n=1 Tax=Clostridium sp. HBUAS56017 TaxID=2571128 RepID=UPI001FAAF028|nr:colicin E3/pyocin S6 family cytotoxin [Clostridium sp. HBUAS56017]
MNGRDVYRDSKTGNLYAVDSQHGRIEMLNAKGKHKSEVNFDLEQTKPANTSGEHNLKMK